jgi:hypothetical protein
VSGTPLTVVQTTPVDRRFRQVYPPTIGRGSATPAPDVSPYLVSVTASPVPAVWRRVNTPLIGRGTAEPVPGPVLVVAAPRRKILAPQPIIITGPSILDVPASPAARPLVFPGPNPRRTTRPPFILTTVAGIAPTPPVGGDDIDWCPGPPFTDWHAGDVTTGWSASAPGTNWMALTPVEDC